MEQTVHRDGDPIIVAASRRAMSAIRDDGQ
jgi:hypothetical protein